VSAHQPRAVQPARRPAEVVDYLRGVRIGPSAEGSFVLSVHTPVPPRLPSTHTVRAAGLSDEPFERRVSLRIYEAVRAAYDAANAALVGPDGLGLFTDAVPLGVSANLCEALVGLAGPVGHPVEVSVNLAPSRPWAGALPPVRFRTDHYSILESAARELRATSAEEDSVVVGNVVRLHREGGSGGAVGIAGAVEGEDRLRRVWVELSGDAYQTAVRAHEEMRQVSVRGDIVRRGNRAYLVRSSGFQILPESPGQ